LVGEKINSSRRVVALGLFIYTKNYGVFSSA